MVKTLLSLLSIFISSTIIADKLVIISPHRKSIQSEFIPKFKQHYKQQYKSEVTVDWIDQGGTENDLRYITSKYQKNPKASGIDVFWGGGDITFIDLSDQGLLEKYEAKNHLEIPAKVAGIDLKSEDKTWYGSALSSFGIFYNKRLLKILKKPEPTKWEDLGLPTFYNQLAVADPRRSSTSLFMNLIIIEALGWEKAWNLLFRMAGNTQLFAHSSSDPIKAIVSGNSAVATAIDFYANAKILDLGISNLGFNLPTKETVFNSDPIGILKGAPNLKVAKRFVDFVLSKEGQRLFILKKGEKGGPRFATLGRMAVNPLAYDSVSSKRLYSINPFKLKPSSLQISSKKLSNRKKILSDLIGAIHIDVHQELKKSWKNIKDQKNMENMVLSLSRPPISEDEMMKLAKKWSDNIFRNKKINEWISVAQRKYKSTPSI